MISYMHNTEALGWTTASAVSRLRSRHLEVVTVVSVMRTSAVSSFGDTNDTGLDVIISGEDGTQWM